jgi:DNA-binding CsgD family transcriptional regulator
VPGVEQEPKQSETAAPFDFLAPGQRWRFVDSFEREGVRYVVVSAEPAQPPSLLVLTRRERQVVAEAAGGSSNQQIAQQLGISHATVRVLMARAANRLGVRTRKALLAHPALQEQGSAGTQASPRAALFEGGCLQLAEQPVSLAARTGTEK